MPRFKNTMTFSEGWRWDGIDFFVPPPPPTIHDWIVNSGFDAAKHIFMLMLSLSETSNPMAKLSVIVPVYNEGPLLRSFVERLISTPCPIEREFIFLDDGSQDDTYLRLAQLSKEFPLQVIKQEKNQGKSAAVRRGIEEASGDFIMIQDADFEYDPSDVPTLLKPLLDDQADVVYGSRFKQNSPQVHRTYHYFVNRLLTALSNLFSGIYLTDMETCYKLFRADLIKSMNLTSRRFEIEVELTAYSAKTSARIFELPISYLPRTRMEGKKIGWRDGVSALYYLVRYNFFRSFSQSFTGLPEKYHPRS